METVMAILVLLLTLLTGVGGGRMCRKKLNGQEKTFYCEHGCCESDETVIECCSMKGVVIGSVIAGVIFLFLMIIAILVCCKLYQMKRKRQRSSVDPGPPAREITAISQGMQRSFYAKTSIDGADNNQSNVIQVPMFINPPTRRPGQLPPLKDTSVPPPSYTELFGKPQSGSIVQSS